MYICMYVCMYVYQYMPVTAATKQDAAFFFDNKLFIQFLIKKKKRMPPCFPKLSYKYKSMYIYIIYIKKWHE